MNDASSNGHPACAACKLPIPKRICMNPRGTGPKDCPTLTRQEVLAQANSAYQDDATHEFARQASRQEADCYANRDQKPYVLQPTKTRMVEVCEFAHKMNYNRLGLAFCVGLSKEAGLVENILKNHGFEVVSVSCKAGRSSKKIIGISDEEQVIRGQDEAMCNPVYQACLLNHEKTDFNVLLGLCVGHDSLFFKYAEAPTTVLAAKDRVTGHNPLAAIYLSESYYRKITRPER
jgi:uncharacterized metal-binding protein